MGMEAAATGVGAATTGGGGVMLSGDTGAVGEDGAITDGTCG